MIDLAGMSDTRAFNFNEGQTRRSVLSGVTIRNGNRYFGAGIRCGNGSSSTIQYCVIEDNSTLLIPDVSHDGGGIHCTEYSSPLIFRCIIRGNHAGNFGGGIYCRFGSSPLILESEICNFSNKGMGIGKFNHGWVRMGKGIQWNWGAEDRDIVDHSIRCSS